MADKQTQRDWFALGQKWNKQSDLRNTLFKGKSYKEIMEMCEQHPKVIADPTEEKGGAAHDK